MNIRKANMEDYKNVRHIYDIAKQYMNATGNANQWPTGYPYDDILLEDIKKGQLYLICQGEEAHAVFMYNIVEEEEYKHITHGNWLNDREYGVIHRVASDGTIKGVLSLAVSYASQYIDNLKMDTHPDNKTMQNALEKNGFVRCGQVLIANGYNHFAYQRTKNT